MSWLRFLLLLVQTVLEIAKALRDQKLITEAEGRAATETMELTVERLKNARAGAPAAVPGRVPDNSAPDPFRRD